MPQEAAIEAAKEYTSDPCYPETAMVTMYRVEGLDDE